MSAWRNKRSGITSKSQAESKAASANVDLRKLRRVDLLELLVDQIRENEDNTKQIQELTALSDRLKAKLDEKDEQIERLKTRLNGKDAKIAALESHLGIAPDSFVVFDAQTEAPTYAAVSTAPSAASPYAASSPSYTPASQQVVRAINDEAQVVKTNENGVHEGDARGGLDIPTV